MKILLVRPVSDTYIISPPIGLGYIATAIRETGINPDILDCAKERLNLHNFKKYVEKLNPDLVGFQVWSCDVPQVKKSLRIVKAFNNQTITIIGGAHPSGDPIYSLEYFRDADFGFRGEGEEGIKLLVKRLFLNNHSITLDSIPGLIWRENNKINVNSLSLVNNLDSFGFPAWDLIPVPARARTASAPGQPTRCPAPARPAPTTPRPTSLRAQKQSSTFGPTKARSGRPDLRRKACFHSR